MDNNVIQKILKLWDISYYTYPLLLICVLTCILVGLRNYRREKNHYLLLIYAILTLLLFIINVAINIQYDKGQTKTILNETSNTLFAILEFILFAMFLWKILKSKISKIFLSIAFFILLASVLNFLIQISNPNTPIDKIIKLSFNINILEFFSLLIACLIFFYESLHKELTFDLPNSPSFWVITGLFIYCIASIPFLSIGYNLQISQSNLYILMYSIHYICLSIFFIALTKAFLCKMNLPT